MPGTLANSGYSGAWTYQHSFSAQTYTQERRGGGYVGLWAHQESIIGILGDATARAIEVASARGYEVSHQIICKGPAVVGVGDRLTVALGSGTRYFYIQSIEDPGGVGRYSLYDVYEGTDSGP